MWLKFSKKKIDKCICEFDDVFNNNNKSNCWLDKQPALLY